MEEGKSDAARGVAVFSSLMFLTNSLRMYVHVIEHNFPLPQSIERYSTVVVSNKCQSAYAMLFKGSCTAVQAFTYLN